LRPLFRQPPQGCARRKFSNAQKISISQAALPWLPGDKPSGRKPSVKSAVSPASKNTDQSPFLSTNKPTTWWIDFGTMWSI
jgi:hypothetical protein